MSEINAAGAAYAVEAEDDVYADMTDPASRVTWTDAGIKAFLESLRRLYGDDFVDRLRLARIESDARARVVDCRECGGPSTLDPSTPPQYIHGYKCHRLSCGHSVRAK
jgi:hypothetical protein